MKFTKEIAAESRVPLVSPQFVPANEKFAPTRFIRRVLVKIVDAPLEPCNQPSLEKQKFPRVNSRDSANVCLIRSGPGCNSEAPPGYNHGRVPIIALTFSFTRHPGV